MNTLLTKLQFAVHDQTHAPHAAETLVTIDKTNLLEVCQFLCHTAGGRLFTMVGSDKLETKGVFTLDYVFAFDTAHQFITVRTLIDDADPTFPSIASYLPAANWYEREVHDLLGLAPVGHPDLRPLVLHGDWPEGIYPLRKNFSAHIEDIPRVAARDLALPYASEDVTQVPVGPIHAGIIEPGHFRFGAVGDTVLHLDAQLFYTHRGLEKASEGMSLSQALLLAERICGVCALSHTTAFAQAVEQIGQVEIPPRAKYLRTLFLELERLYNHIGDVGNVCAGFGFAIGVSQGLRLKEELLQLNHHLVGHRYLRGVVELGGLKQDLTEVGLLDLDMTLQRVEREFSELVEIIFTHRIALNRMATTGVLTQQVANDLEVVGVAARASGRNVDVRRDLPYAAYQDVKFTVPVYLAGDVLARVKVRVDEVFQSIAIIRQVMKQLPVGEMVTAIPTLTPYSWGMGWVESPRGESVHRLLVGPDQTVYRYRVRSATYSNWPAVGLTVPGNIVPDFPVINKSFELCYACCDR